MRTDEAVAGSREGVVGSLFGEVAEGHVAHHSMIVCHRDGG